jgi:hypothetical protein
MSAEIQTSLFILTAEIAAVTGVAALVAAGLAWARGRARLKAAQALRDAAQRLPGEGEVVQKERELLGEFARAYLTRDAERLAGLPARLLSVRQAIEAAVEPPAPAIDPAEIQAQAMQALEEERAKWQTRLEGLEQQRAQTQQQLDTALATINTLVQEYGRGRGQEITPTAEALLQALVQVGGVGMAAAVAGRIEPAHAAEAVAPPDGTSPATEPEGDDTLLDLAVADEVVIGTEPEPAATTAPAAEAAEAVALPLPHAEALDDDQGLDLSVPVEPVREPELPAPPAAEAGMDELDALDIDALLDAELGRQARLLTPPSGAEEDLDLSRTDAREGK